MTVTCITVPVAQVLPSSIPRGASRIFHVGCCKQRATRDAIVTHGVLAAAQVARRVARCLDIIPLAGTDIHRARSRATGGARGVRIHPRHAAAPTYTANINSTCTPLAASIRRVPRVELERKGGGSSHRHREVPPDKALAVRTTPAAGAGGALQSAASPPCTVTCELHG